MRGARQRTRTWLRRAPGEAFRFGVCAVRVLTRQKAALSLLGASGVLLWPRGRALQRHGVCGSQRSAVCAESSRCAAARRAPRRARAAAAAARVPAERGARASVAFCRARRRRSDSRRRRSCSCRSRRCSRVAARRRRCRSGPRLREAARPRGDCDGRQHAVGAGSGLAGRGGASARCCGTAHDGAVLLQVGRACAHRLCLLNRQLAPTARRGAQALLSPAVEKRFLAQRLTRTAARARRWRRCLRSCRARCRTSSRCVRHAPSCASVSDMPRCPGNTGAAARRRAPARGGRRRCAAARPRSRARRRRDGHRRWDRSGSHRRRELQRKARASRSNLQFLNQYLRPLCRADIVAAARRLAAQAASGSLRPDDIDDAAFASALQVGGVGEPDLIIRSSGEQRLSNFMLWQAAHSELVFCDVHWPDFGESHLAAAMAQYGARQRRFGGRAV